MLSKDSPLIVALLLLATAPLHAQAIVGSWLMPRGARSDTDVVATFLANGTYLIAEDGPRDSEGQPGMERGTYKWNASTKAFSSKTLVDTTADWGLSHGHIKSLSISGSTMTSKTDSNLKLTKIASKTNKLVGTWYLKEGGGYAAVTFLANGSYFMVQDGKASGGGKTGFERGTYTWNTKTKVFRPMVLKDTNGTWGFSDMIMGKILISNNTMTIKAPGDGSFTLARVVAP